MKFIIEHLEKELYDWCLIEYEHISKIVGKENLIFTNVSSKDVWKLDKYGIVHVESFSDLDFDKICVLSQYAEGGLSQEDAAKFDYFLFGGILGDNPAKKRTNELIDKLKKSGKHYGTRNLTDKQMPTDVAVFAAKKVLEGAKISDLKFVDEVEIQIKEGESTVLPFRYVVDGKKAVISEKMVEYLRKKKGF
ncbi:hypothetical protein CMO83_01980 [Candidatus Woesearchaeota archaeon]|jgi:ribosome biogenesis SPOUT family RNA methylase Rps3|nr:hypothetical protein [Candidatus Woesearchaeota archaeon]MDP6648159.1 SAM-dependent methyltransferase [Candidatus Woesearchaeota archaeon]|tara:strand:+ start:105507 stop:106082 length:576 start_codon:yes stop_codon:yes gene_type:complete